MNTSRRQFDNSTTCPEHIIHIDEVKGSATTRIPLVLRIEGIIQEIVLELSETIIANQKEYYLGGLTT